jgi:topoisomerase IA-like protein
MHCVMSQITIKLSDKADALIAQLQKEIFNRRRKKVTAAGVVETLVESGAKSQSDKRFATSWTNLIKDIEKAAKLAYAHGSKPSTLTDEEWALVLSHRSRSTVSRSRKTVTKKLATKKLATKKLATKKLATKKPARRTRTRTSSKSAAELSPATRDQAAALKAG